MTTILLKFFVLAIIYLVLYLHCREWALNGMGFKRAYSIGAILAFLVFYAGFLASDDHVNLSIFVNFAGFLLATCIATSIFFDKPRYLKMK